MQAVAHPSMTCALRQRRALPPLFYKAARIMGDKPDANSHMSGFTNTIPNMVNTKRLATATAEDWPAISQQRPTVGRLGAIQFALGAAFTRHANRFVDPIASSHNARSAAKQPHSLTSVRWSALKRNARLFARTPARVKAVHGVRLSAWSQSVL